MEHEIMNLERAKLNVEFPEISNLLFWENWGRFTDIEYDALQYLVNHSSRILLPNVKELSRDKKLLLINYTGFLLIGDI